MRMRSVDLLWERNEKKLLQKMEYEKTGTEKIKWEKF